MKIFAGVALIGAVAVGGFLWWKKHQVEMANEIQSDPWPSAVAQS